MTDHDFSSHQDLVAALLEEFLQQKRKGQDPSIEEYVQRHPEFADDIRDLFLTVGAVEHLKPTPTETDINPAEEAEAGSGFPTIPDYRILRQIGRGGMGIVYEAEQVSLGRRVALKVLPHSMTRDESSVERFRLEARSAAALHHSNIVPVFEVGGTEHDNYYAMQYIRGDGLDRVIAAVRELRGQSPEAGDAAADRDNLTSQIAAEVAGTLSTSQLARNPIDSEFTNQTSPVPPIPPDTAKVSAATTSNVSELVSANQFFRNVARVGTEIAAALEHAHEHGIIHRDIKPSNILLDTEGRAWVADFGLAKSEELNLTKTGNILGTLRYMSPERFSGDCDEKGDQYAIGATLYEMVTLQPAHLETDQFQLMDAVKSRTPMAPRAIDASIPRDLETIITTALEKIPERRYPNVGRLKDDLQRFLDGKPIVARQVSTAERFVLWVRNNKTTAALLSTLIASLVIGMVTTSYLALAATRANKQTVAELDRKSSVVDAFVGAFESIQPSNEGVTFELSAHEVLETALKGLEADSKLDQDPLVKRDLLNAMADSLSSIGKYESAVKAAQEAHAIATDSFGEEHRATVQDAIRLATLKLKVGEFEEALSMFMALKVQAEQLFGPSDDTIAQIQVKLGETLQGLDRLDEAISMYRAVISKLGKQSKGASGDVLAAQHGLARCLSKSGQHDEAVAILESLVASEAQQVDELHPALLVLLHELAGAYRTCDRNQDAVRLYEDVLDRKTRKVGRKHPSTLATLTNMATLYDDMGDRERSYELQCEAVEAAVEVHGPDHPTTLDMQQNLVTACLGKGLYDEAVKLAEQVLAGNQRARETDHNSTLTSMNNLAYAYGKAGRLSDSLRLYEQTLELAVSKYGKNDPRPLVYMNNLASSYRRANRTQDSVSLLREAIVTSKEVYGNEHFATITLLGNLAASLEELEEYEESAVLTQEVYDVTVSKYGEEHPKAIDALSNLALSHDAAGNSQKAMQLQEKAVNLSVKELGEGHPDAIRMMSSYSMILKESGRIEEAISLCQKVVKLTESALGDIHPKTISRIGKLASALREGNRIDEAIVTLQRKIERMRENPETDPKAIEKSLAQLADAESELSKKQ